MDTQERPFWISLEGSIGVGKSFLLSAIKKRIKHPDVVFIDEPVKQWDDMLKIFYQDKKKNALAFQVVVLLMLN